MRRLPRRAAGDEEDRSEEGGDQTRKGHWVLQELLGVGWGLLPKHTQTHEAAVFADLEKDDASIRLEIPSRPVHGGAIDASHIEPGHGYRSNELWL